MNTRNVRRGFTLVEILIVVIILGILAAVVMATFTNTTGDTRRAALAAQLDTIRAQIQLYTLQHGDTRPVLGAADWSPLAITTVYDGQVRGPYLQAPPRNALNGFSNIAVVVADPAFGDAVAGVDIGFVYNSTNGFMWATNTAGDRIYNEANPYDPLN